MNTRQAIIITACIALLAGPSACSASPEVLPSPTPALPTSTATVTFTPSPLPPTATPTPLTCLSQPGLVLQDVVSTTKPPQEFLIYLPPCYDAFPEERYPTLYLLHGQTYNQDQWVRLGAPAIADELIHSEQSMPFIMVFPDDRYWNSAAGPGFGDRLINDLIPYVDKNYRTVTDRQFRALGGLSRGGGWTVKLGLENPLLFGVLGLHSPAIFKDNAPYLDKIIKELPQEQRPYLWMDIGDSDSELGNAILFEQVLTDHDYIHEFHRFAGEHSEAYWSSHTGEYLRWYTQVWQKISEGQ